MKYFVKFFVVTFFLLFSTDVIAEQKIVVLDLKYVLNNSKAGKNAQDFLKKSYNNNLKKYADMEKALKKEEQDLLTKKTVLNKEEYTTKCLTHLGSGFLVFLAIAEASQTEFAQQKSFAQRCIS